LEKIFLFFRSANRVYDLPSHPERGALRNVINAGRGAVDADGAFDEGAWGGRQRRVVLMPRRWHQVLREDAQGDGGKQARLTGESTL
jgi:hypothetical protein